jgi:hypothetical protein
VPSSDETDYDEDFHDENDVEAGQDEVNRDEVDHEEWPDTGGDADAFEEDMDETERLAADVDKNVQ